MTQDSHPQCVIVTLRRLPVVGCWLAGGALEQTGRASSRTTRVSRCGATCEVGHALCSWVPRASLCRVLPHFIASRAGTKRFATASHQSSSSTRQCVLCLRAMQLTRRSTCAREISRYALAACSAGTCGTVVTKTDACARHPRRAACPALPGGRKARATAQPPRQREHKRALQFTLPHTPGSETFDRHTTETHKPLCGCLMWSADAGMPS
jgi:hypothetical protein